MHRKLHYNCNTLLNQSHKGKMMKKIMYTATLILSIVGLNGCSSKSEGTSHINKEKTIMHVTSIINQHKTDKFHSAIALAIDEKSNYLIGYAFDAASKESAQKIAMQKCNIVMSKNMNKIEKSCQIYLLDNKYIRTLK